MVLTTQIGPSGTWARPASTAGGSAGAAEGPRSGVSRLGAADPSAAAGWTEDRGLDP